MPNTKLNKTLIRKIIAHLKKPKDKKFTFDMGEWGLKKPRCGTTCCIGGDAMLLSGYKVVGAWQFARPDGSLVDSNSEEAGRLLGAPNSLFFTVDWPPKFRNMCEDDSSEAGQRKTAIAYLTHLLETGK